MSADSTRILAIGDMHLGRAPARVAGVCDLLGRSLADLGPGAAWARSVEEALARRVDAVLLAGDLVDSENARFEAWGQLQRGVERLHAGGIPVLAVAGNHDVAVLPRLAAHLPGLTLLGADGRWQSAIVGGDAGGGGAGGGDAGGGAGGGPPVEVVGWSFPRSHVTTSPLAESLPPGDVPVAARLGLLHADLDASGSRYAPVSRAELANAPVQGWLLGHIHRPDLAPPGGGTLQVCGYLGSVVGLDPSETGPHGPWLLTVTRGGTIAAEHLPLAPLRWERTALATDEWHDPERDLEREVPARLDEILAAAAGPADVVAAVTLELDGRCRDLDSVEAAAARLAGDLPPRHRGQATAFLAAIQVRARPAWDLTRLARHEDLPGLLARRLLELEAGEPAAQDLLDRAVGTLRERALAPQFAGHTLPDPGPAEVRERLLRAGFRALDRLLRQKEGERATA
ncbi:MAG: metallophosphoesterase [Candidatus Krumholzibacteriia bacterium]